MNKRKHITEIVAFWTTEISILKFMKGLATENVYIYDKKYVWIMHSAFIYTTYIEHAIKLVCWLTEERHLMRPFYDVGEWKNK